jgi:hypothetical protein
LLSWSPKTKERRRGEGKGRDGSDGGGREGECGGCGKKIAYFLSLVFLCHSLLLHASLGCGNLSSVIQKKKDWCVVMFDTVFRLKWRIFASKSLGHESWGLLFLGLEVCFCVWIGGKVHKARRKRDRKRRKTTTTSSQSLEGAST